MTNIFTSIISDNITLPIYLLCAAVSVVCGIIIALSSSFRNDISRGFFISLITLPFIVGTVIIMVNGSIGTGIAVMGAFSLIRFRSAPGKARDIAAIFTSMTAGLICAAGYPALAVIFTLIVSALTVLLNIIPMRNDKLLDLRIAIPESLNYTDAFEDLFDKYTSQRQITSVKTTDMGSLYKLHYRIKMKDMSLTKEFIDELRCRNGNLEIMISEATTNEEL